MCAGARKMCVYYISFLGQFAQVLTFGMLGPDLQTRTDCYILSTARTPDPLPYLRPSTSVKLLKWGLTQIS